MIHAYDEVYLDKARGCLGRMLDFACYDLHYDIADFFDLFLSSGVAAKFERGESGIIVGSSGVELAYKVLEQSGILLERVRPRYTADRSEEYWTGWALAWYQWETARSFREIIQHIPIRDIQALYSPYHEMDIRQFGDRMEELYRLAQPETKLKWLRQRAGVSQGQLAQLSGVPVRTIQQYEQRQKNINKAQAEYLVALAKVLSCNVVDLIE